MISRLRDVLGAAVGLVLCSPILAVTGVAIRLESPGPVFFRQRRVGRHGSTFHIHKFRTMTTGTTGPAVTSATDPRITRLGRILRRTKLDELPQLIDVLRGDMSLVGPRPELPRYVDLWDPILRATILSVRPGITDPVTVLLRDEDRILAGSDDPERTYVEELLPLKARAYAEYVQTRSFWGDLGILVATLAAIVPRTPGAGTPSPVDSLRRTGT